MDQSSSSGDPPQNSRRARRNWRKLRGTVTAGTRMRRAVSRPANASGGGEAGSDPGEPSEIRTPQCAHVSPDVIAALRRLLTHVRSFQLNDILNYVDGGIPLTMSHINNFEVILEEFKRTFHIDSLLKIQEGSIANSNEEGAAYWTSDFHMCDVLTGFLHGELERNKIEDSIEPQVPNEANPMEKHIRDYEGLSTIVENIFQQCSFFKIEKEKVVNFVNEVVKILKAFYSEAIEPTTIDFEAIKLWVFRNIWGNHESVGDIFELSITPIDVLEECGTALHWAVELEDKTLVEAILKSEETNINATSNWMKGTPLHMVVLKGNRAIVRQLLQYKERIRLTETDIGHRTPVEIAHTMGFADIERALMECDQVSVYVDALYKNRQVYVDAANAILVGAAFIASVTFASWLQLPLANTLEDHVNVEGNGGLRAFWVFNSLSFYFAMGTVVFGARSVLPRQNVFIRTIVEKLRVNLLVTSILLGCSVFFVIIAFGIAGCIVLTPTLKVQWTMIAPTIVGGLVCVISLGLLLQNIWDERKGARIGNTDQYLFGIVKQRFLLRDGVPMDLNLRDRSMIGMKLVWVKLRIFLGL